MTVAVNNLRVNQSVYLPWTNANNSLFCITYKIGRWKSDFSEQEYKTIIAESLNTWTDLEQLKEVQIKIAGYLISNQKVFLVLYPQNKITHSILDLFFTTVQEEIDKRRRVNGTVGAIQSELKSKKLFEPLPVTSQYIVLLITGRKVNIPYYNPNLARLEAYIHNYNFCSAMDYSGAKGPVEVCLLKKYCSPFYYNVGINYQPPKPRTKKHETLHAELNFLSTYFSLIKTFSCTDDNSKEPKINEEQQQVIDFVCAFKQRTLQLIMASNNSALAQIDKHNKWVPGLMTKPVYADKWVHELIRSFGSKEAVLKHLACITLGNEVDAFGPKMSERKFEEYYLHWIPEAFSNLKRSLAESGLHSISVSSALKNYSVHDPQSNPVAFSVTKLIYTHWSHAWNQSRPFIFFDHYTSDAGRSIDFKTVEHYFNEVQKLLKDHCQVFVGQTGYSTEFGAVNQAHVINHLFRSLYDQYKNFRYKIPVCIFEAYDRHHNLKEKKEMGLFEIGKEGNYKLKEGIEIPGWVKEHI